MKFGVFLKKKNKISNTLSKKSVFGTLLCLLCLVSCSKEDPILIEGFSSGATEDLEALFTLQNEVKERLEEESYVTEASVTIVPEDEEQGADFTVVAVFLIGDITESEQEDLKEIVQEYVPEVETEHISLMFDSGSVG